MTVRSIFDAPGLADAWPGRRTRGSRQPGLRIAVHLTDGFSLLSLASITDALTCAGQGREDVGASLFGPTAAPVMSCSGIAVTVEQSQPEMLDAGASAARFDALFLLTGTVLSPDERRLVLRLARAARLHRWPLCAIGTAVRTIAEGGLVTRCTDHWRRIAILNEVAPSVVATDVIFLSDGNVVTSPGELATVDYILHLIRERLGGEVASAVGAQLLLEAPRAGARRQPCDAAQRYRGIPANLAAAVERIEQRIEEPAAPHQIAAAVGLSVRQLERLFVRHIGTSPQRYSRRVQLDHALKLLEQSSMEVVEVALACGFREASTFNKRFKETFGVTPSQFRRTGGL